MPKNNDRIPLTKLSPSTNAFQGTSVESLEISFVNHLEYSLAKDEYSATDLDFYKSLALTTRDRLIERWVETQQTYYKNDVKRVYYLSMEYLTGRLLRNALINLGLEENMQAAMRELGLDLKKLEEVEPDAGLGNGGLGRLAACFLDSMATLELPCYGYGIRYEYGIFTQEIVNGHQVEHPDSWLHFGNPWEIERPEFVYTVKFYGHVNQYSDENGKLIFDWLETDDVLAIGYDTPVPGYRNNTVNHLRLWAAKSSKAFNLTYFNDGDYEKAVADKVDSETISRVLYPNDDQMRGRELRLKQEYFFVSATLQDILRRYKLRHNDDFAQFTDKVVIQLNDTHPAIAVAELMRLFLDEERMDWQRAWSICTTVFAYTNHTVLPEALEKWLVSLFGRILPRHLQIIYEINRRFLELVAQKFPNDVDRIRRMSLIEEEPEKRIRMANLAIVGSFKVNGVAALHTEILKTNLFKDFYELWPEKFTNKTNGITQRRWLKGCNPALADLITETIDDGWLTDLRELKKLTPFATKKAFQNKWQAIKRANKKKLADYIWEQNGIAVNLDSIFDCQVKRIHEYKRQLLNVFHVITLYHRIKANPSQDFVPRTVIFAGKAAPGYEMARLIIKLINAVAEVVNNDPDVGNKLKVVFLADYSVSLAEKIIPAADLSEQISTAGMEASGTGNMKFALNGALTIGTLDGANIEILEEVGEENIFIFGLTAEKIVEMRNAGYNPWDYYHGNSELKTVIDMIAGDNFSPSEPGIFRPVLDALLHHGDFYMVLAGYESYVRRQQDVNAVFADTAKWAKMSILNVANIGKFSSDRTIREYAEKIWNAKPASVTIPTDEYSKSWKSAFQGMFKKKIHETAR
jgi:starch phosphorylase